MLLLLGSLAWVGLVAGAAAGAAWLVPEGSGLAGPAEALGYGVLGLLAGLALGALLGWRAGDGLLRAATAIAVALALLAAGLIVWRIVALQAERSEGGLVPPPAGMRFESRIAEAVETRIEAGRRPEPRAGDSGAVVS